MPSSPSPRARSAAPATVDRVLDVAERLVQTRGFNGFSYADVSAEVGITTASLHYHFPGKAELGRALIERYATRFLEALAGISAGAPGAAARLSGYARLYGDVLTDGRMCLCGMLAAEYETLPAPVQRAIRAFFDANEVWLTDLLESGRQRGEISFTGPARDAARQWTSTLEGSMLLARPFGDASRLTDTAGRMIDDLTRGARGSRSGAKGPRRPRA
jgi:TetR/AcrR family transcriptional repressor of nem operon